MYGIKGVKKEPPDNNLRQKRVNTLLRPYALSWKPCQGDSLNLPDHRFRTSFVKDDENLSTQHHSVCNSSEFLLPRLGVLTKDSEKRKQNVSNVTSARESVITSCSKQPFPKLTREEIYGSVNTSTGKDLWEDFRHEKSFHIPTPALDEVCEEYFSSMKQKGKVQSNIGKSNNKSHVMDSVIDLGDPHL
ncbi:hypothetical protein Tco_0820646 [Tanacetum coccineum]|uniref:Uncharacterized protein n=1 Tax=Tanacetum coccineum TaxID=301880 RepID=A0ABQ5ACM8_9ASTR